MLFYFLAEVTKEPSMSAITITYFCDRLKELVFSTSGYGKSANDKNSNYEQKIDELQTDLNTTRVKLIEKEREVERLDAQVKTSAKSSPTAKGKLSRSGSQEEDLQKKIQVQLFSEIFSCWPVDTGQYF